jgi:hypothetical protein
MPGAEKLDKPGTGIQFLMFYNKTKYSRKAGRIDLGVHVIVQNLGELVDQVQSMSKLINTDDITGVFNKRNQIIYSLTDDFQAIPSTYYPKQNSGDSRFSIQIY